MEEMQRYIVGTVPDTLFTRNELNQLGKVPLKPSEFDGYVVYPDQKREYKLYHIEKTREPKKQRNDGIRLTATPERSLEEILKRRKEYSIHGTRGIGIKTPK